MTENYRNEENTEHLFGKFLDPEQAKQAAEDVRTGERILGRYPAPTPDNRTVADIKLKISGALLRKRADNHRKIAYKAVISAAVIITVAVLTITLIEKAAVESEIVPYASKITPTIWDSDNIAGDDAELALLTAEIEQIEGQVLALQLGDNGGNGYTELVELEMELVEINSDFWKG